MSLNTIKDHDHDLTRTKRKEYDEVDGVTTKRVCADPECDYYITQWEDNKQASISTF